MQVIKNKYIFLGFSGFLTAISIFSIAYFGLAQGIDFSGGTLWQIGGVSVEELKSFAIEDLKIEDATFIPESSTGSVILRMKEIPEELHQQYFGKIKGKFSSAEDLRFESIGPAVGGELRSKAIWAFVLVLFGISTYIAFAFRKVSRPVASWKYGLITLLTLFHDALIPAGLFAFLGYLVRVEVDTNFIVAILVVMGFSVHDTIVVFDRIRENLRLERNYKFDFNVLVNKSVNETFARSINTSLTLVIVLIALFVVGAASLKYFILTILVGTVIGTYSSIFVASPLLTIWRKDDRI